MYSQKPIPSPFQGTFKKTQPVREKPSATPIEATEKIPASAASRKGSLSPLAALLFWDLLSNKKGDE